MKPDELRDCEKCKETTPKDNVWCFKCDPTQHRESYLYLNMTFIKDKLSDDVNAAYGHNGGAKGLTAAQLLERICA